MVYVDENGQVLESVDLTLGYLEDAEWTEHPEIPQRVHYEYEALRGGGRLQRAVVDTPYTPAWREVTKQRYVPYTDEELALMRKADHAARLESLESETAEQRSALEALMGGVADA